MRTNIVLDDDLVERAFAATGARTKKQLIHLALEALIRTHTKKDLSELAGKISFRRGFDHKAMRKVRGGSR